MAGKQSDEWHIVKRMLNDGPLPINAVMVRGMHQVEPGRAFRASRGQSANMETAVASGSRRLIRDAIWNLVKYGHATRWTDQQTNTEMIGLASPVDVTTTIISITEKIETDIRELDLLLDAEGHDPLCNMRCFGDHCQPNYHRCRHSSHWKEPSHAPSQVDRLIRPA